MKKTELINALFDIEAIKFGSFKLKSGIESPIYIDLRLIISYPALLRTISEAIWEEIKHCSFDLLCGVPYTALPIATAVSLNHSIPMVMRRKEVKEYGLKKTIEGAFVPGQTCLIIEDLVTSGASVMETITPIEHEGLKVKDVVVLIDREQGGKQRLEEKGYKLYSVLTLPSILSILNAEGRISKEIQERVIDFIFQTQV